MNDGSTWRGLVVLGAVAALAGCGGGGGGGGTDAGGIVVEGDAGGGGTCHAPTPPADAPYGTSVGRSFRDFTLNQCDGTPYTFYNEDFCVESHSLTVVSIAAGWCGPCMAESAQLTDTITEAYRDRGVRVIQVLVQDPSGNQPDSTFCNQWVSTYGLTNIELMDPLQITNAFFPDGSLPSTLIIDDQGIIRFRENGASMGLVSLRAAIDSILASP